jgi:TPR repeat protein
MRAVRQSEFLSDEPPQYAAKRVRAASAYTAVPASRLSRAAQLGLAEAPAGEDEYAPSAAPRDLDEDRGPIRMAPRHAPEFEGDVAIRQMRERRVFAAEVVPEPQWRERPRFPLGMLLRTGAAVAAATFGALVFVGSVPVPAVLSTTVASLSEAVAEVMGPSTSGASMVAAARPPASEPAPTETPAADPAVGASARDIQTVAMAPWPASPLAMSAEPPSVAPAMRRLDAEEIEALIRRGEAFILQGDFAAARLMLQRAAEAGNGRAAVMLGATYDPVVLRRVGVVGFKAEPEHAREWYERAVALGASEASDRK